MATKPNVVHRSPVAALLYGAPIGLLGGLIGLGGAVPAPGACGCVSLPHSQGRRPQPRHQPRHGGQLLADPGRHPITRPGARLLPVALAMIAGSVSAAFVGVALVHRISEVRDGTDAGDG